jgi:DnaJ like chaperone protein
MIWERAADTIGGGEAGARKGALARLAGWLFAFVRRPSPQHGTAFTSAFVGLAAKMAKADGVAVRVEWEAFARFIDPTGGDGKRVRRLYDLAKQDTSGFEAYAVRIGILLEDDPELLRRVLECLMYIACADGVLHPAEDHFLAVVAEKLGIDAQEFRHIRSLFVSDGESPYEILGVSPTASDAQIRKVYLRLVGELHPDRLIASGAEPAIVKAATVKLAAINSAYEAIVTERGEGVRS